MRATLPVSVLISPDLRIDDNNTLIEDGAVALQQAAEEFANQAPPLYEQHQFDRLYSDIDMSGYRTPGPMSGSATPFGALSRNISSEDLPSLEAITNGDISASALHSRLSHLHASRGTYSSSPGTADSHDLEHGATAQGLPADYFSPLNGHQSGGNSHSHSPENGSRRASDEQERDHLDSTVPSGMATPHQPQYMEVETLSRVPSYTTAIRSTARTQYDSGLPDYDAAVLSSAPRPLPPPQQAHLRSSGTSSPTRMPTLNETLHRPLYAHHHISHGHDDDERRLRLTQARVDI